MKSSGTYKPKVRSPLNIALVKDVEVGDFILDVKLRSTGKDSAHRDLCLFFGHQAADQFYYVHIAKKADTVKDEKDNHATRFFSSTKRHASRFLTSTPKVFAWDDHWHQVRIVRKLARGRSKSCGRLRQANHDAVDKTLGKGKIGVGSFDDTGHFAEIKITEYK